MSRRGRSSGGGGPPGNAATRWVFSHDEAVSLYNEERFDECVALCRRGVAAQDSKAQVLLGRCYIDGSAVEEDEVRCIIPAAGAAAQSRARTSARAAP